MLLSVLFPRGLIGRELQMALLIFAGNKDNEQEANVTHGSSKGKTCIYNPCNKFLQRNNMYVIIYYIYYIILYVIEHYVLLYII